MYEKVITTNINTRVQAGAMARGWSEGSGGTLCEVSQPARPPATEQGGQHRPAPRAAHPLHPTLICAGREDV